MKTFEWRFVKQAEDSAEAHPFLLEVENNHVIRFWGVLEKRGEQYSPIIWNKDRTGYIGIKELLTLEEAKLVVEQKMMQDGIINDGDIVNDYVE